MSRKTYIFRIFMVVLLALSVIVLPACSSTSQIEGDNVDAKDPENSPVEPEATDVEETDSEKLILLDDDWIKATYLEVFEVTGVDGAFYLSIQVENKSDKELWVYLDEASVNGTEVIVASGVPMTIQPGNNSKNPFIISYANLNIDSLEGPEDISFKFAVSNNETMEMIETSDEVTIPFD